jgi:hypothetical protein
MSIGVFSPRKYCPAPKPVRSRIEQSKSRENYKAADGTKGGIRDNDPLPPAAKKRTLGGVGTLLGGPSSLTPMQPSVQYFLQALDKRLT